MKKGIIFILYDSNKILLQYRDNKAPTYQNTWCFFGGACENGESYKRTAIREMYEELSYTPQNLKMIFDGTISPYDKHPDGPYKVFTEKYQRGKILSLQEGDKMEWYSIKEVRNMTTTPKGSRLKSQLHLEKVLTDLEKEILSQNNTEKKL